MQMLQGGDKMTHNRKRRHVVKSSQTAVLQVYQAARTLKDMLALMPDEDLAKAKRLMYDVEDLIWQALDDRR